jgi:hypothetical protein
MALTEDSLLALIRTELERLDELVTDTNPWVVELPNPELVDVTLDELAGLVAKTSNNYARLARLAGMARAHAKIAKGRFERKSKRTNGTGSNERARVASVMAECQSEHAEMVTAEAMAEIVESLESAARIASESSRKLYDKAHNMLEGETRGWKAGGLRTADLGGY